MSDAPATPPAAADPAASAVPPDPVAPSAVPAAVGGVSRVDARWVGVGAAVLAAACAAAVVLAWNAQQRLKTLEGELVKRQQDSAAQATEAKLSAKQSGELARDAAARIALLEARVAETSLQRGQLEELIQSLARSRDENVLADVDAALRVALQQTAITGSAEPLLATLRQSDERLARFNQPRLERVRRAIAQDIDRVRSVALVDVTVLTIRLDELVRQVDDLPLVSSVERRAQTRPAGTAAQPAAAASDALSDRWRAVGAYMWNEMRSLVRVTRIDQPEAMLLAPEQAFFLRENLKLRLLNARLALLSRQFDVAQSDLRDVQQALDRHFERGNRRVASAAEAVRQMAQQARQVAVPRPDATLAAIATATPGAVAPVGR